MSSETKKRDLLPAIKPQWEIDAEASQDVPATSQSAPSIQAGVFRILRANRDLAPRR